MMKMCMMMTLHNISFNFLKDKAHRSKMQHLI